MTYIYSDKLSALDNMLFDSYLVQQCKDEYLRIYQWSNPAVSLGITNKINEINLSYTNKHNIDIVRRETGGGIVYHNQDLCFSFITNANLKPKENYHLIKDAIEKILHKLGEFITKTNNINTKSLLCFNGSSNHEISIDNKKVIGIAQKLVKNRYLMQGSIQLKSIKVEHLICDSDQEVIQYGLDNIKLSTIKDSLYNDFAKMYDLIKMEDNDILNTKEYINFKRENENRFYGDN